MSHAYSYLSSSPDCGKEAAEEPNQLIVFMSYQGSKKALQWVAAQAAAYDNLKGYSYFGWRDYHDSFKPVKLVTFNYIIFLFPKKSFLSTILWITDFLHQLLP